MKFLIIGASGFIGRQILRLIWERDFDAIGTRASAADTNLYRFDLQSDRLESCIPRSWLDSGGPVWAVICSCICQLDRCRRDREISSLVNVTKTIELLNDLARLAIKPIFISSSYVHDGQRGYYSEESPPNPINEYGRQKLAVEEYIAANLPHALVLRLDKVVGDDPDTHHLFSEWDRSLEEGRPITCIADQILSPTLATDVAQAIVAAAEDDLCGLFHVANSEFFSREELARQFAFARGCEASIISKPLVAFSFDDPRPLKSYLDSSKFVSATGLRFTSMRDAFESYFEKKQSRTRAVDSRDGARE